ncbi:MAG: dephospho-CoA kinase [Bacteroidetes bacterium]|nr:dephospho-CoA kinase [Bacteroidota bacterium]
MLKIGITGGIGSGKTTVCKVFETLGIPVFYADEIAKQALTKQEIISKIKIEIDHSVLNSGGEVDRLKLAEIVFKNESKLKTLNSIIHPFVAKEFDKWVQQQHAPYILKEAAILFESGSSKNLNKVISVVAKLEDRITRVMARNKITRIQVEERINNQISDEERIAKSDFIIYNNDTVSLIEQVITIDKILKTL